MAKDDYSNWHLDKEKFMEVYSLKRIYTILRKIGYEYMVDYVTSIVLYQKK